jgi:hypothetical protein
MSEILTAFAALGVVTFIVVMVLAVGVATGAIQLTRHDGR